MAVPVLAATLTIIASFLPLITLSGSPGEFIRGLPLAVTIGLACSFAVAMLLTPLLCRFFIKKGLHDDEAAGRRKKFLQRLAPSLLICLRRRPNAKDSRICKHFRHPGMRIDEF